MALSGQVGQQTLFPLRRKAVWMQPHNLGTADCQMICGCDDSCEYAVKDKSKNALTPHAEWFCTHLADLVGIAGPVCQIIDMQDGTTAFGSRWHDGALPSRPHPAASPWWQMVKTNAIPLASITPALSRIYAFDHFVHNTDRHAGNLLVLPQRVGYSVLAFDYSRAWTFHGFPSPALPFNAADPNEKTVRLQRQLRALWGNYIDPATSRKLLETLAQVPVSSVEKIISEHPDDWMNQGLKDAILSWWSSSKMTSRLNAIAIGIENGTYL
jgi:hypothetical protein